VLQLRSYGKKIQSATTSLGHLRWSDDKETLSYKELELRMGDFKRFVSTQVELAQAELERLLLLHPDETREGVVPVFRLRELKDNPAENRKGWSFLRDGRNREVLREDGDRWLLDRVLDADWLRQEFVEVREADL
jgi:hypothetical protein